MLGAFENCRCGEVVMSSADVTREKLQLPSPLRNITISLTLACNQACSHCWVDAGSRLKDELSNDEIAKLLTEARELGVLHVKFTGGEPFARRGFAAIIGFAIRLGLRVSVETNGALLSTSILDAIGDSSDRLQFFLSLDDSTSEGHDAFRRSPGAFDATLRAIGLLRTTGIAYSIHTVVGHHNARNLHDLISLVRSLGARQHKLIFSIHNLGRGHAGKSDALSVEEVLALVDDLPTASFWDYQWNASTATTSTQLMTTLPPAFRLGESEHLATCGWAESYVGILADGRVALCHGLYESDIAEVGDLRTNSLREVWERSEALNRAREVGHGHLEGVCGNCRAMSYCRGLCRASAIAHYGSISAPYPFCQMAYDDNRFPQDALIDKEVRCEYVPLAAT
jgi:AdoMet-dependent heme synthase